MQRLLWEQWSIMLHHGNRANCDKVTKEFKVGQRSEECTVEGVFATHWDISTCITRIGQLQWEPC